MSIRHLKTIGLTAITLTVVLSLIGPGTAFAKDPPGLGKFMNAMGRVESGGNYRARNKTSGAYGKYQIMPSNWPSWARTYLGNSKAKPTPANQEKVARGKFKTLYRGLHSWRRVAYWWLTGSSHKGSWSPYATKYVAKVMRFYTKARSTAPGSKHAARSHRFSEKSGHVTYTGSWRSARHPAYAGNAVRYAVKTGAAATVSFTGRRFTWYGPVGPTRGKARITIDGKYIKTVDLHRAGFSAHAAVFSRSWSKRAAHTVTIKVVGTKGHPMIAVDEFVVRD